MTDSTSLTNSIQGTLSNMHTRHQAPQIGQKQQWMVRVVNSLLSLLIRMTNHTSHTGIAMDMWATPKRPAVRGHPEPFKLLTISLLYPSPSIQMTTFTSPTTIPTMTLTIQSMTCSTSPTPRALGPEPSLRTLEPLLAGWLSTSPSTQQRINLGFHTLIKMKPR